MRNFKEFLNDSSLTLDNGIVILDTLDVNTHYEIISSNTKSVKYQKIDENFNLVGQVYSAELVSKSINELVLKESESGITKIFKICDY